MRRRLPSLVGLRAFECAARHLSFTAAADELCVTQAAVSHQIKALEEWLGISLFTRLNGGIKLTESGKTYARPLTQVFDQLVDATADILDPHGTQTLSISTFDSIATSWLLSYLQRFGDLYSDLAVRVISTDKYSDFWGDDIDLEIRYGNGDWPKFHVIKIADEEVFPVCSPALLKTASGLQEPEDVLKYQLIHDVMTTDWDSWLIAAGAEDIKVTGGLSMNHSHLVIQAAIAGQGIALGRSLLVKEALQKGVLIKPFDLSLKSDFSYYLVHPKKIAEKIWVKKFCSWLLKEMKQSG